jgi:hypothetical protein
VTGITITHIKTPHSHKLLYGMLKEKKKKKFEPGKGTIPKSKKIKYYMESLWLNIDSKTDTANQST